MEVWTLPEAYLFFNFQTTVEQWSESCNKKQMKLRWKNYSKAMNNSWWLYCTEIELEN